MDAFKNSLFKKEAPSKSSQNPVPPPKILLVASEIYPFAKTGGLADVVGALPRALIKLGCEIALVLPKYKSVSPEKYRLKYEINGLAVPMGMGDMSADVLSTRLGDTYAKIYFVQC